MLIKYKTSQSFTLFSPCYNWTDGDENDDGSVSGKGALSPAPPAPSPPASAPPPATPTPVYPNSPLLGL